MDYGKNFKRARNRKGLDQKDAAAALDVSASYLSRVERNIKKPNLDLIIKAAALYGVDKTYLLEEQDEININDLYTKKNEEFVRDLELMTLDEVRDKYNIQLDGKELTKEEIKAFIAFIRSMRSI